MSEFEKSVKDAAEKAVLKIIAAGDWVMPSYENRFKMPPEFAADVWKMIDADKVRQALAARIESELADKIVNLMAAEIATDVKQILSVQERREALRAVVRENFDRLTKVQP